MIIIATFSCGCSCRTKVDTVVVAADPPDVEEVIRKLSLHSCHYQGSAEGYDDLVVLEGTLVRCELLPESSANEVNVLVPDDFRRLWAYEDQLHREVEEELRSGRARNERGRPEHESQTEGSPQPEQADEPEARCHRRTVCVPPKRPRSLYAVATFTDDGRAEIKAATVLVNIDAADVGQLVKQMSLHSCHWQSCPTGNADLIIAEGTLVRCEMTPIARDEQQLLTFEEFQALWQEEERHIQSETDEMSQRLQMRERAAIREKDVGGDSRDT